MAIYVTRRLCKGHYAALRWRGGVARRPPREQLFWSLTIPEPNSGCLLWMGSITTDGYGQFGSGQRAHRVAWALVNGPIPAGMEVCHRCDNPLCVFAERSGMGHLFLGTRLDNERDKTEKGRRPVGEQHRLAKLTDEQVLAIRREYASTRIRQRDLAAKHGVGQATIHYVVTGKHWAHLGEVPPRRPMGPPPHA